MITIEQVQKILHLVGEDRVICEADTRSGQVQLKLRDYGFPYHFQVIKAGNLVIDTVNLDDAVGYFNWFASTDDPPQVKRTYGFGS